MQPTRRTFLARCRRRNYCRNCHRTSIKLKPLPAPINAPMTAPSSGATQPTAGLQATPQNLQHPNNQDENLYPNKLGNYSKGLPHNDDGTVVLSAYNALLQAINSGSPADFDAIPLGGTHGLTNPQSGLAFDLQGPDAHAFVQPPAPAFASRAQAAEISENYWMALLRDVPYSQYRYKPDRQCCCRRFDVVRR